MIGRISGTLVEKNPPLVIVDCAGVGYEVAVPMSTFYNLPALSEKVVLLTQQIVREDAHLLFGFATDTERLSFRQLLKVSGVGPKVALAILSGLSVNDLAHAVQAQETGRLTNIPGIGKKTAERLMLELKGKFDFVGTATQISRPQGGQDSDVLNALLALGYSEKEAAFACKLLPEGLSVSDGIRQALKALSK